MQKILQISNKKPKNLILKYLARFVYGAFFVFAVLIVFAPKYAKGATLNMSPAYGKFTVGSTFEVSILVKTEGQTINAIETSLIFPPDKLQLVSPSAGKSVIGVWTAQPTVNNQTGRIDFQGGIPGGLNVSSGLVTTLTFRVKSVGQAIIRFGDNSKVLLHDGKGTNALINTTSGVYDLVLPPPQGPAVASETHPDQDQWYRSSNVVLFWALDEKVEGYSYILNSDPVDLPDDIIDSDKNTVTYRNLPDGIHYFHIRAFRQGEWGGVTHFAVRADNSPPASFKTKIIPSSRTVRRQPIFDFSTTDSASGVDHYELKIIPLTPSSPEKGAPIFIEASSPYVPPEMLPGKYDIVVRAYDKAGNFQEQIQNLNIVNTPFNTITEDGLQLQNGFLLPWWLVVLACLLILAFLIYLLVRFKNWHKDVEKKREDKSLPDDLKKQLEELGRYKKRYGKLTAVALFFISFGVFGFAKAEEVKLSPPVITTISKNITNEDIFYVGGNTGWPNVGVVVYVQNLQSGEVFSSSVQSDKNGEWFYRHSKFLPTGSYFIWSQSKLGEQSSPPGPQEQIVVRQTALQFGSNRMSYEFVYLVLVILFSLISMVLTGYIVFHFRSARRKHRLLVSEIKSAEESIKRGFAVLRRDIEAELEIVKTARLSKTLSEQEKEKEQQLMKDLQETEKYLSKEIWKLEEMESKASL